MRQPFFNWLTYKTEHNELKSGTRMNVSDIYGIRPPKEDELTRMLCFKSGVRQTKELQNWPAWNGCVYIDVDYKNWMKARPDAEDPVMVFAKVWTYLAAHFSAHFYYGEYSRSKKGFHFIFYMDTDYPIEERRDLLLTYANAAVIKAFDECGLGDAIRYREIKNRVEVSKVLDTCTNTPYQMCYITLNGKINEACEGDWRVSIPEELNDIVEEIKKKAERHHSSSDNTYKARLLKENTVQAVPYIEHLVRRRLFKSLSTIFEGDDLKREWTKCAKIIPEEHGHTTDYYINAPYKNDWNASLSDNEYCDKDLLEMFGYEVKIDSFKKQLTNDELLEKINYIVTNKNKNK